MRMLAACLQPWFLAATAVSALGTSGRLPRAGLEFGQSPDVGGGGITADFGMREERHPRVEANHKTNATEARVQYMLCFLIRDVRTGTVDPNGANRVQLCTLGEAQYYAFLQTDEEVALNVLLEPHSFKQPAQGPSFLLHTSGLSSLGTLTRPLRNHRQFMRIN